MPIPPPDGFHFSSAAGWLQLGDAQEALCDLEKITRGHRSHPDVLHLHWHIRARLTEWDACVEIGEELTRVSPDHPGGWINHANALFYLKRGQEAYDLLKPTQKTFPDNEAIPYNLSCYACQFGNLELAARWFKRAQKVGDPEQIREVALNDPDMEPLWESIRKAS